MDTIEALRERADLAQRQLSDQDGQRLRLFERLSDRINAVADELRDNREAIAGYDDRVGLLSSENDQLREILQSLLKAIEADASHGLSPALRGLESKISTMVETDNAEDDGQIVFAAAHPDDGETIQELADDVIVMAADPAVDPQRPPETATGSDSEDEPDADPVSAEADPIDALSDIDGWSEDEMPTSASMDDVDYVDADDSVIDDLLEEATATTEPGDEDETDPVSQLNAIGDIVQRLMKEMSDDDEVTEGEVIDAPEAQAS